MRYAVGLGKLGLLRNPVPDPCPFRKPLDSRIITLQTIILNKQTRAQAYHLFIRFPKINSSFYYSLFIYFARQVTYIIFLPSLDISQCRQQNQLDGHTRAELQ